MNSYLFFLSYARDDLDDDQDRLIERFYYDLASSVRLYYGPFEGKVGFFDTGEVGRGKWWTPELDRALWSCRVFVSVYSPTYFTRRFCGQEWGLFQSRLAQYTREEMQGQTPPALIQPVLLAGKEFIGELPETARDVNYFEQDDPPAYVEGGLKVLMLKKNEDDYKEFVANFAKRVVELAKSHPMAEHPGLRSVREVPDAFRTRESASLQAEQEGEGTLDQVEFFFVAGQRGELKAVRHDVACYGLRGGGDWRPFEPLLSEKVVFTAQRVATRENFVFGFADADNRLIERLDEAKRQKKIVALVVDSWSLRLQRYADIVRAYDTYDCVHCIMLVCLNIEDEETVQHLNDLKAAVREVFDVKTRKKPSEQFLYPVSASDEFEEKLSNSLKKVQMILLGREVDELKLALPAGEQRAAAGGGPPCEIPTLVGPGAAE